MVVRPAKPNGWPSASTISKSPSTRMEPLLLIVILAGIPLDASRPLNAAIIVEVIHLSSDTGGLFEQAFTFSQKQVRKLVEKHPGFYPLYTRNGKWQSEGPAWTHWCDGFMPGMMWIFAKHAAPGTPEADFWKQQAIAYTTPLAAQAGS